MTPAKDVTMRWVSLASSSAVLLKNKLKVLIRPVLDFQHPSSTFSFMIKKGIGLIKMCVVVTEMDKTVTKKLNVLNFVIPKNQVNYFYSVFAYVTYY